VNRRKYNNKIKNSLVHKFLGKLFGSSGVRGISNVELTPNEIIRMGQSIVTEEGDGEVLIAHDTRTSKEIFLNAMISGLLSCGAYVKVLGLATTPSLAYLTSKSSAKCGVMITASHNPPQYNGIKVFNNNGMVYDDLKENRVEDIYFSGKYKLVTWNKIKNVTECEYELEDYIELISNAAEFNRKWNIALDIGCGALGFLAPRIIKNLNLNSIFINAQPDGFFPGRFSEPTENSLKDLSNIVKALDLDAGIAFDGDADRVAFIDDRGNFVSMDKALAAYSAYLVEKDGGIIVVPLDTSLCVDDAVIEKGGKVVRTGVGDSKVAKGLKNHNAIFGGEVSGAWINPKFHLCPDGILSAILFLKAVEESEMNISEFTSEIQSYPILRTKVKCPNILKGEIMKSVNEKIAKEFQNISEILTIDGVRISTEKGWLLIRPSGTEPTIRIVSEAKNMKLSKEYFDIGLNIIKKILKGI
jgi:phosphoglucosamine mutase